MKPQRTKEEAVHAAWQERERLEAIAENTLQKYGRVSDSLAEQLLWAEVAYAVAKDNRSDRCLSDD